MNLGKTILELRKAKNVTQEDMAAELGVTAAAVSKWENGYTLPDIMMLCAIADCFHVTTDELLGRATKFKYAVAAVSTEELGQQIAALARQYGFIVNNFRDNYADALKIGKDDPAITHVFVSLDKPMLEKEHDETFGLHCVESHADTLQKTLDGFEIYFKNMGAIDSISGN